MPASPGLEPGTSDSPGPGPGFGGVGSDPAGSPTRRPRWGAEAGTLPGDRVVVKVISPEILHKSDVGGVKVVANDAHAIAEAIRDMEERLGGPWHVGTGVSRISGYTINEFIPYDRSLGHELLLGLRWTGDFGAVVTFGPGGIYTEFLAQNFKVGRGAAIFSP